MQHHALKKDAKVQQSSKLQKKQRDFSVKTS